MKNTQKYLLFGGLLLVASYLYYRNKKSKTSTAAKTSEAQPSGGGGGGGAFGSALRTAGIATEIVPTIPLIIVNPPATPPAPPMPPKHTLPSSGVVTQEKNPLIVTQSTTQTGSEVPVITTNEDLKEPVLKAQLSFDSSLYNKIIY